jgi:hypothetical protein
MTCHHVAALLIGGALMLGVMLILGWRLPR